MENQSHQEPHQSRSMEIFSTIFWLSLLILVAIKMLVLPHVSVVGQSMQPNYATDELLLVNQVSRKFQRGQVVAAYRDDEVAKDATFFTRFSATFYLKRIIGLPNEEIEIIGGDVIIYNDEFPEGRVLVEDYIPFSTKLEQNRTCYFARTEIPENSYFVLGDNRGASTDSRSKSLGTVNDYAIFGKEVIKFWPLGQVEAFDLPEYEFEKITEDIQDRKDDLIAEGTTC